MATLAEIRQRLEAAESKQGGQSGGTIDNAIYPHWKIDEGSSCLLRFLPDGNEQNTYFWEERQMIQLPFNGVKGQMDSNPVLVKVPCVEMWEPIDSCPILSEVRTWFKDPSLEELGRKYWKKRSYVFQGFVRENPISDDTTPENPIRRFIIAPQIFGIIKSALMDPELEEIPTDYAKGLDFRINKTTKGKYSDYATSNWSRRETPLTEDEQAAIEQYGLFNLSEFLPNRPSDEALRVMKEMFEASVDGEPYDPERWSAYYRPAGMQNQTSSSGDTATSVPPAPSTPTTPPEPSVTESSAEPDPQPVEADTEPKAESGAQKAEDILAMIRSRQSN